ncbi:hypothetical protein TNCV_1726071 [Trichonephila clavipes]|nr:hypothetical protein TNCV_1726071 [Trichonephila clavipes]
MDGWNKEWRNTEGWARVTADAPRGFPWRKEMKKLKEEFQNLMAPLQNRRRRNITCWGVLYAPCKYNRVQGSGKKPKRISRGECKRSFEKTLPGELQKLLENRKEIWRSRSNNPPSYNAINIGIGPVE